MKLSTRKVQSKLVQRKGEYHKMHSPYAINLPKHMELTEYYYGRTYCKD